MTTSCTATNGAHESEDPARNPWLGVEVRHLAALTAVAHEGSFRGAANALGYVQSAVSQQVAHLERVVGHKLFERKRGAPPTLTGAGRLLLAHAEEIVARLSAARIDLHASEEIQAPVLRLGTLECTSTRVLPRILSAMHHCSPGVRIRLTEADHGDDLLGRILDDELDLAFVRGVELEPRFASVRLMSDPIVLVVAADSELGGRTGAPTPEDIGALELIGHRMMFDLEPRLRDAGIEPRYTISSERNAATHALVAAGVGAAIVPALAVDASDPRVRVHPLDHLVEPATMRLAWLRGRQLPPACSAFTELAQRIVETIDLEPAPGPALAAAA